MLKIKSLYVNILEAFRHDGLGKNPLAKERVDKYMSDYGITPEWLAWSNLQMLNLPYNIKGRRLI